MKTTNVLRLLNFLLVPLLFGPFDVHAWTELPVHEDKLVFMPGSQQGTVSLESATRCDNCHGGYNKAVEPAHNWRGSMMASVGVIPQCTAPPYPTGVKATPGKRKATLSWTAVLGATGYNVYYAQGGKYSFRAKVTGTNYTDTGLTTGNTYCYAVSTFVNCEGQEVESETYSPPVCTVLTR
jgi:hypothetical protein